MYAVLFFYSFIGSFICATLIAVTQQIRHGTPHLCSEIECLLLTQVQCVTLWAADRVGCHTSSNHREYIVHVFELTRWKLLVTLFTCDSHFYSVWGSRRVVLSTRIHKRLTHLKALKAVAEWCTTFSKACFRRITLRCTSCSALS